MLCECCGHTVATRSKYAASWKFCRPCENRQKPCCSGRTWNAESFEAINIEVREMPQLSARDEDLAKQIAALYQEMAQLFDDGELTKEMEKEFDEDIENIFNQMSPEAQNPWGAETFEATNLRSRKETEKRFGKDLAKYVHTISMGAKVEPSHFCECGNELTIYPRWDVAESHKLGKESLMAECEKCGWTGVVQRAAGTFDAEENERHTVNELLGKEVKIFPSDSYSKFGIIEQINENGVLFKITRTPGYSEPRDWSKTDAHTWLVGTLVWYSWKNLVFRTVPTDNKDAETILFKDSCGCGATIESPCDCMKMGVMNCSANCPCSDNPKHQGTWEIQGAESPSDTIPSWATQSLLVDALVAVTGLGLGFFGIREWKKRA